jgi:3-oxoacyl-[acyl-carrier protein] reductase
VLKDQVAVVTGGGQGIGRAIALRFAREGADIAVIDVNRETAEAAGRDIRDLGRRAVIKAVDVSDFGAVEAGVTEIVEELGRIDVLVNNAGIEKRAAFLEITPAEWQRQLDVNLSGTFYCTQAAARQMAERKYGRIVNLSSVAGLIGPIDLAAYGAAKAGIVGLTRAAALDLADYGITVNAIAPGRIETELMLGVWSAEACGSGRSTEQSLASERSTRLRIRRSSWPRPNRASSPALRSRSTAAPWLRAPPWSRSTGGGRPLPAATSRPDGRLVSLHFAMSGCPGRPVGGVNAPPTGGVAI